MRLDDEIYEYIKGEVCELFVKHDVRCIPISGFELATRMGIKLVSYSSLPVARRQKVYEISPDGFYLEMMDGTEYIYYNDDVGYERSNMTILHEIGHCVLGHTDDTDPDVAEAEAAFFAKYAAAPPPLVHRIHPDGPDMIAEFFCISCQASCNSWNYYCNWRRIHNAHGSYTTYENRLISLFEVSA